MRQMGEVFNVSCMNSCFSPTIYGCRVSYLLIFWHERTFISVLFSKVLNISLFHQRSVQIIHVSVKMISIHDQHPWAGENPYGLIHSRQQQQFCIYVWAGIVDD
jgi:hypothetical protein